jgi:cold shock CspA family protein|eukprot:TRINITY_DN54712_c0_g1_i1.p1 TRINITY_DN54712_c0_g1~~TRINITY_DN54712_c0_g1_i1.p1  ORF type:complete len:661 (-),score=104.75 TRINITY_DN54712_c0_g1_i1:163-2070(-)
MADERLEGTVADWNERGYGFVHSIDGRRAYVHNSQCGGQHLVPGEAVTAIFASDDKNPGKYQAIEVERLNPGISTVDTSSLRAAAAIGASSLGAIGGIADAHALQEGVVQDWNERGYGFIGFSDGRRAYVHNSHCGGEHLQKGETVYAIVAADEKNPGKFQATQVQRIGVMAPSPSSVAASVAFAPSTAMRDPSVLMDGRVEGIVQEWNERGFGFIGFVDGRRAYVHNSQCGNSHLAKGEIVTAIVLPDEKNAGKFQAMDVQKQSATPSRSGSIGDPSEAFDPSSDPAGGGRMEGVVCEWSERGFGFIMFTDGRRAYVHNTQCGGDHLIVGEAVSAVVTADGKNSGKLAAMAVQRGPAGEDGVVQDWRVDGGYGFLLMDDSRRVYVHRSDLGGVGDLQVGQRLRVTTKPDARNPEKWCVSEIKGEIAQDPAALMQSSQAAGADVSGDGATSGEADGTVADWKEAGYGFLAMDDGRRVYVHRSRFGGTGNLVVGQRLRVTTQPDPRNPGKWCVDQVLGELLDASGVAAEAAQQQPGAAEYAAQASAQHGLVGDIQEGTVSEWRGDGGYGFLSLDDGRYVYIHRSSFGGVGSLVLGSRVQVTVKSDPRNQGKWSVDQIIAGDVAMPEGPSPKRARIG